MSPAVSAARALVADLVAHGVCDVVLAPGSRSAPLAYALAEAADAGVLTLHVRVDERDAAFLALGLSKGAQAVRADRTGDSAASPVPVAVVTTSGTAVANLHPAVLEAHHTGVPLLLLTADRPHELRGTGASQTTDQVGIFGSHVRYAADVPAPDGRAGEVRDLLATTARALTAALGLRDRSPGPVHLNLAFREPLHPEPAIEPHPAATAQGFHAGEAWTATSPSGSEPGPVTGSSANGGWPVTDSDAGEARPARRPRPVVVPQAAGPGADPSLPGDPARTVVVAGDAAGPQARALAQAQGWPLFAEPSSGACGGPNAVRAYRSVLGVEDLTQQIEHVVVFGHPTLSRPVQQLLARPDVEVTVVAPGGGPWPDAARNAAVVVDSLHERWFMPPPTPSDPVFLGRWQAASRAATAVIDALTVHASPASQDGVSTRHGGARLGEAPCAALTVARAVAAATHADDVLVVGSSNPVRDLDLVLGLDGEPGVVLANRGLAGIDGTVSTASGVALAAARAGRRTRALVGDLTFLHDVGGLLRGPLEPAADLQLVVVNDDGGSIFATLEHGTLAAASPAGAAVFERVFGTPHGADFAALCAGYRVRHRSVDDVAGLRAALAAPGPGVEVVEVRVPRKDRLAEARTLHEQIVAAAREAIVAAGLTPRP